MYYLSLLSQLRWPILSNNFQISYYAVGDNWVYVAQFHGSAHRRILRLSWFPTYGQAPNLCASLVRVEYLVTWSTHGQKPKFAGWTREIRLPLQKIPCCRKHRLCGYGKQNHEIGPWFLTITRWPGPNFKALLTVNTESALTEAGNFVLTASVFHGLAANFCLRVSGESWS